ncbi:MAG: iron ABC transporter permease [Flavobacteriales bacterium]|nr:iron ABC transporter permease [Flavobacteriales bacterium]
MAAPLLVVLTAPWHTAAPEWAHVSVAILPVAARETGLLLLIALCTAWLIALPSAWLVATTEFRGRRLVSWALVLPLAMPTYIAAYTFAGLLGPTGSISNWSAAHLGVRPDIVHLPGLGVVLGLVLFPYVYLPARAAFAHGMTTQREAAALLGATGLRAFLRIGVPLARPALAAGSLLLAMEVINDFGAAKHFGVRTLTTGLFRSWGGLYDLGSALRIGMVLIGGMALLLWIERHLRRNRSFQTDQVPTERIRLRGAKSWLATAWCMLILFFTAGLPLASIVADVFQPGSSWLDAGLGQALTNSLLVAAGAALLVLSIAILLTYRERHGRRADLAVRAANLGYAIPGAVIAVGAMAIAGPLDRSGWHGPVLIGSLGLLLYAYAARFLAVGTQPLFGALRSQPRALDESALVLGASAWRVFTRINLPLLRPALLAAAMLVAIDVMKELPLTLILRPFNFETLSTAAYRSASIEQLREASRPALLIVLCAVPPVLLLNRLLQRQRP